MKVFDKTRNTSNVIWFASLLFMMACFVFAATIIIYASITPRSQSAQLDPNGAQTLASPQTNPRNQSAQLDPSTHEVVIQQEYYDGSVKELARYSVSTEGINLLLDPLYAGNAPLATSYDPEALYASDALFGTFEYNRGQDYGDTGTFSREQLDDVMTIKFDNSVISWVDADGVIASALQVDENEWCIAIY